MENEAPADWPELLSNRPETVMLKTIRDRLKKTRNGSERRRTIVTLPPKLTRCKALFDSVDSHSLSPEQREAVVVDEDRNLLIAAAGSGKTSVLAAKVVWLLQTRAM